MRGTLIIRLITETYLIVLIVAISCGCVLGHVAATYNSTYILILIIVLIIAISWGLSEGAS